LPDPKAQGIVELPRTGDFFTSHPPPRNFWLRPCLHEFCVQAPFIVHGDLSLSTASSYSVDLSDYNLTPEIFFDDRFTGPEINGIGYTLNWQKRSTTIVISDLP